MIKLPKRYGIDFMAMQGNSPCAWVELKCRNNRRDDYSEYMISLAKWFEGRMLAKETRLPFVLAVRMIDADLWVRIDKIENPRIGFGGRIDRNDWQDQEPMIFLSMKLFKGLRNEAAR